MLMLFGSASASSEELPLQPDANKAMAAAPAAIFHGLFPGMGWVPPSKALTGVCESPATVTQSQ
ncbi:hypothetical protein GCM10010167_70180 [Paractinoplanes deccanensis]